MHSPSTEYQDLGCGDYKDLRTADNTALKVTKVLRMETIFRNDNTVSIYRVPRPWMQPIRIVNDLFYRLHRNYIITQKLNLLKRRTVLFIAYFHMQYL
jgi:hypothetical protein